MSETQFPPEVEERLKKIATKFNVPLSQVVEEFNKLLNDPWIKTDPQFKTDVDRYSYCLRVIYVRYAAKPPTKQYTIIPFGYTEPRTAKSSGVRQSRIYAIVRAPGSKPEKRVILCRGTLADLVYDVELFNAYNNVELAEFGNLLMAVNTTKFENPKTVPVDPLQFMIKHVGAIPIKIADAPYKLSRKQGGFVDELDLRLLRAIVVRYNRGKRPDGSEWAVYTVADDSIEEQKVTPEGIVIPTQFTVWVPASMMKYDIDSELAFVGTVTLGSDKVPFMNAICVIPIYARPLE